MNRRSILKWFSIASTSLLNLLCFSVRVPKCEEPWKLVKPWNLKAQCTSLSGRLGYHTLMKAFKTAMQAGWEPDQMRAGSRAFAAVVSLMSRDNLLSQEYGGFVSYRFLTGVLVLDPRVPQDSILFLNSKHLDDPQSNVCLNLKLCESHLFVLGSESESV